MTITVTLQITGKYKNLQWVTLEKELFHKEDDINIPIEDVLIVLH